jgi:hypothetical protein
MMHLIYRLWRKLLGGIVLDIVMPLRGEIGYCTNFLRQRAAGITDRVLTVGDILRMPLISVA